MSFYNKYRPQRICELHLTKVREQLLPILSSGKLSQVYIFVGPKGTGKTSAARILAKLVNCGVNNHPGGEYYEPCNERDSCKRITNGSSLAVMEMDAASNRGIDDIRLLKERVMVAPSDGRYSVYIIDEVHMLTNEAFNALLKTLEEPPAHALFFLCTTDPQKIPETVMSRGTRIQYSKATSAEIKTALERVIKVEKLVVNDQALLALCNRVDGSFRDGMKLLEQLAANNKPIDMEMVDELTGNGEIYRMKEVIELLLKQQTLDLLQLITNKWSQGAEPVLWYRRLVEEVRRQILALVLSNKSTSGWIELELWLVSKAEVVFNCQMPEIGVEAVLGGWCERDGVIMVKAPRPSGEALSGIQENKLSNMIEPHGSPMQAASRLLEDDNTSTDVIKFTPDPAKPDTSGVDINMIHQKWPAVMSETRIVSSGLETALRGGKVMGIDGEYVLIEVGYKLFKDRLEQDKYRKLLEAILAKIYGVKLLTRYSYKNRPASGVDDVSAKVDDPVVSMAAEAFGAL